MDQLTVSIVAAEEGGGTSNFLLPNGRLSGWSPDWYAGFPAYTFYMVVPSLAIVALDVGFVPVWLAPVVLLACAALAYNILRWIGLVGLLGEDAPIRHEAKRRRLRTVMQELVYVAARVVESGRRLALKFSRHCPAFPSFEAVYGKLAAG